jgi:hypothetical protein
MLLDKYAYQDRRGRQRHAEEYALPRCPVCGMPIAIVQGRHRPEWVCNCPRPSGPSAAAAVTARRAAA